MNNTTLTTMQLTLLIVLFVWTFVWKGIALWYAAGRKDKIWFIVLLLVNTAGILDMFYIFIFSKRAVAKPKQ